jgi:hypothetical protein
MSLPPLFCWRHIVFVLSFHLSQKLAEQPLLHFKYKFLKTFHAILLPYEDLHIVTAVDQTILEEVIVPFHL